MQKINHATFLCEFQRYFGLLHDSQKAGLEFLLNSLEADTDISSQQWAAYMLATTWHETGHTLQPIQEYGHGAGHKYGIPDPVTHQIYYGRGDIQLTWIDNYKEFARLLEVDLVNHPELADTPEIAYRIMSIGMRRGLFTGVGLIKYFNNTITDPVKARKIVNGSDCAQSIAGYYADILKALKASTIKSA